jgi:nucleoside-diphosphate-sugar epimerase
MANLISSGYRDGLFAYLYLFFVSDTVITHMPELRKVVLITGGGGFIGRNLVKRFVASDDVEHLIILDNFITGNKTAVDQYVEQHQLMDRVTVYEADVCSLDVCMMLKTNYSHIDEIYHFASIASPPLYKKHPLETLDVGYVGTKNMLELCRWYTREHRKSRFMLASTSEVYGNALEHPQEETYYGNVNPCGERSCYDESKRIAEALVYTYRHKYGLDTRMVRIFNTYGPYMNLEDGRIVTEVIKSMSVGTPLTIFGTGKQTRSLSFVDDTLDMILAVMSSAVDTPVNVGNDHEISIRELVKVIQETYNEHCRVREGLPPVKIKIRHDVIDVDDPVVRRPSLKKLRDVVGYRQPPTPLEEGILKTIEYFMTGVV